MFEEWNCTWEPQLIAMSSDTSHDQLLNFVRQYGVITSKAADWFYSSKRESKEALKTLSIQGALVKGALSNEQKKITVYSCHPPQDVNECVAKVILEGILDSLLDKFTELEWQENHVRMNGKMIRLEALVGDKKPISGSALWVGADWEVLKTVLQPGQYATTLDVWNNGLVMRYENENWLPGTIEKELFFRD